MLDEHSKEISDLRDVLYAMELRFTEKESEAEQEFQGMVDDLKNRVCSMLLFYALLLCHLLRT